MTGFMAVIDIQLEVWIRRLRRGSEGVPIFGLEIDDSIALEVQTKQLRPSLPPMGYTNVKN